VSAWVMEFELDNRVTKCVSDNVLLDEPNLKNTHVFSSHGEKCVLELGGNIRTRRLRDERN